jgi:hypothetical protein
VSALPPPTKWRGGLGWGAPGRVFAFSGESRGVEAGVSFCTLSETEPPPTPALPAAGAGGGGRCCGSTSGLYESGSLGRFVILLA